jgi:hypothetical protein
MYNNSNRINPPYSNTFHQNGMNQMQMGPMYPHFFNNNFNNMGYLPSQTNQLTTEDNSQNNFPQVIKQTIETNFKKLPINFSQSLMNKLEKKFESSFEQMVDFKSAISHSEEMLAERLDLVPKFVEKLEIELKTINTKVQNAKETLAENNNIMELKFRQQKMEVFDVIELEREKEKIVSQYMDDVELLKLSVNENLKLINQAINVSLNNQDQALNEIKKKIINKFSEISKNIKDIKLDANSIETSKINADQSVKKIKEVKGYVDNIINKKIFRQIKKENSIILNQKSACPRINTDTVIEEPKQIFCFKKQKFEDISFFDI